MIDSIHWVFNGLNLGVESRFLYLSPLNPKLSADGKGNPSDLDFLGDAGLTAALGTTRGTDSAILLNLPTRPAHNAIAPQNLGSIKEMHYQHHVSALIVGAYL